MVLVGQRTDWHLFARSPPPEIIASSDSNAGEPMIERGRARELRQPEVRSDKHIMGDLFCAVRWHSPTDDADDMALVSADQVGESVNLPSSNTLKEVPITRLAFETSESFIRHRQIESRETQWLCHHRNAAPS